MSSIPYVKFYPSDWKAGCVGLSLVEEIIYFKICSHNWDLGEPLSRRNFDRLMRGQCEGIAEALDYLLEEKKIEENEEGFFNFRALKIHEEAITRHKDAVKAARKRWKNKKKLKDAPASKEHMDSICQPEPEPEPEPDINTPLIPQGGKERKTGNGKSKRGARIPDNWEPDKKCVQTAIEEGYTQDQIGRLWQCFTDYWRGVPGQKGCKLDWDATWRNYVRGDIARRQVGGNGPIGGKQRHSDTAAALQLALDHESGNNQF